MYVRKMYTIRVFARFIWCGDNHSRDVSHAFYHQSSEHYTNQPVDLLSSGPPEPSPNLSLPPPTILGNFPRASDKKSHPSEIIAYRKFRRIIKTLDAYFHFSPRHPARQSVCDADTSKYIVKYFT